MRYRITAYLFIWILLTITLGTLSSFAEVLDANSYHPSIRQKILLTVKKNLPQKHKYAAHSITSTIMLQANKYKLDPYIITAVIAGESSFNPHAIGSLGEVGLMQLRENTAKWICMKMGLAWHGKKSLKDPMTNIRIGTAYLSYLHDRLGSRGGYLYLAAYNMGFVSVSRNLAKNVHPKKYSIHVMKRYITLNEKATTSI